MLSKSVSEDSGGNEISRNSFQCHCDRGCVDFDTTVVLFVCSTCVRAGATSNWFDVTSIDPLRSSCSRDLFGRVEGHVAVNVVPRTETMATEPNRCSKLCGEQHCTLPNPARNSGSERLARASF